MTSEDEVEFANFTQTYIDKLTYVDDTGDKEDDNEYYGLPSEEIKEDNLPSLIEGPVIAVPSSLLSPKTSLNLPFSSTSSSSSSVSKFSGSIKNDWCTLEEALNIPSSSFSSSSSSSASPLMVDILGIILHINPSRSLVSTSTGKHHRLTTLIISDHTRRFVKLTLWNDKDNWVASSFRSPSFGSSSSSLPYGLTSSSVSSLTSSSPSLPPKINQQQQSTGEVTTSTTMLPTVPLLHTCSPRKVGQAFYKGPLRTGDVVLFSSVLTTLYQHEISLSTTYSSGYVILQRKGIPCKAIQDIHTYYSMHQLPHNLSSVSTSLVTPTKPMDNTTTTTTLSSPSSSYYPLSPLQFAFLSPSVRYSISKLYRTVSPHTLVTSPVQPSLHPSHHTQLTEIVDQHYRQLQTVLQYNVKEYSYLWSTKTMLPKSLTTIPNPLTKDYLNIDGLLFDKDDTFIQDIRTHFNQSSSSIPSATTTTSSSLMVTSTDSLIPSLHGQTIDIVISQIYSIQSDTLTNQTIHNSGLPLYGINLQSSLSSTSTISTVSIQRYQIGIVLPHSTTIMVTLNIWVPIQSSSSSSSSTTISSTGTDIYDRFLTIFRYHQQSHPFSSGRSNVLIGLRNIFVNISIVTGEIHLHVLPHSTIVRYAEGEKRTISSNQINKFSSSSPSVVYPTFEQLENFHHSNFLHLFPMVLPPYRVYIRGIYFPDLQKGFLSSMVTNTKNTSLRMHSKEKRTKLSKDGDTSPSSVDDSAYELYDGEINTANVFDRTMDIPQLIKLICSNCHEEYPTAVQDTILNRQSRLYRCRNPYCYSLPEIHQLIHETIPKDTHNNVSQPVWRYRPIMLYIESASTGYWITIDNTSLVEKLYGNISVNLFLDHLLRSTEKKNEEDESTNPFAISSSVPSFYTVWYNLLLSIISNRNPPWLLTIQPVPTNTLRTVEYSSPLSLVTLKMMEIRRPITIISPEKKNDEEENEKETNRTTTRIRTDTLVICRPNIPYLNQYTVHDLQLLQDSPLDG